MANSRLLVIGDMTRVDLASSNRDWTISNYGTATTPNNSFNIADETAAAVRFRIDADGTVNSFISSKSPIFYDYDDTGYYLDGNSTSRLYGINLNVLNGSQTNYSVANSANTVLATPSGVNSGSAFMHFTGGTSIAPYSMYRAYGDWSAPYGIGWTYGGEHSGIFQRFASNGSSFGDLIYYVGNDGGGAHSFRAASWESTTYNSAGSNQYNTEMFRIQVDGSVTANTRFYTPIIYDANDTGYYCDPNGNSHIYSLNIYGNDLVLQGGSPTMSFNDTDQQCAVLHNNSNLFYILRRNSYTVGWTTVGSGWWPMTVDLTNNNVSWGGDINAAYNIIAYASDQRLKENIVEIPNAIDKIKKIRGVTFDWNSKADELGFKPKTKYNDLGVIAQEIQAVLPQAVAPAPFDKWQPDPDKNYSDEYLDEKRDTSRSGEDYLTVQLEKIVPLLIEGIKEQQKQIERQQQQIADLMAASR